MSSKRPRKLKEKMGGFEKYLYKTLREDPQSRLNFLENLFEVPLSSQIKILRTFRGLTQILLSKKTGLAQSEIARLERLGSNPRLATLERVDKALNVKHLRVPIELVAYWKNSMLEGGGERYF